jgi:hypothetical protein
MGFINIGITKSTFGTGSPDSHFSLDSHFSHYFGKSSGYLQFKSCSGELVRLVYAPMVGERSAEMVRLPVRWGLSARTESRRHPLPLHRARQHLPAHKSRHPLLLPLDDAIPLEPLVGFQARH